MWFLLLAVNHIDPRGIIKLLRVLIWSDEEWMDSINYPTLVILEAPKYLL